MRYLFPQAPNSAIPDTYVRLTLFNQTRAVKTKRTGIVRRSAEPCYNESFHFRLEAACIDATNIVLAIHQPDNKGTKFVSQRQKKLDHKKANSCFLPCTTNLLSKRSNPWSSGARFLHVRTWKRPSSLERDAGPTERAHPALASITRIHLKMEQISRFKFRLLFIQFLYLHTCWQKALPLTT